MTSGVGQANAPAPPAVTGLLGHDLRARASSGSLPAIPPPRRGNTSSARPLARIPSFSHHSHTSNVNELVRRIAEALADSPVWCRLALPAQKDHLRQRAAEQMAALIREGLSHFATALDVRVNDHGAARTMLDALRAIGGGGADPRAARGTPSGPAGRGWFSPPAA